MARKIYGNPENKLSYIWALLRISLGWILLWAFLDKVFGLGFSTAADKTWLAGISPTAGFLKLGATGFLGKYFGALAGSALVDWLFMLGLLLIGTALILGIGMRIASYSGALLMFLMWLALVPSKNNPVLDDHIIYLFVFLGLNFADAGKTFGFGRWWGNTKLVKKYTFLE